VALAAPRENHDCDRCRSWFKLVEFRAQPEKQMNMLMEGLL
jgi:hypothetical protein